MDNTKVNVAPSSSEGHFITGAERVVEIEKQKTETFAVYGPSLLVTKNHTDLVRDESCLVTAQRVYNPFNEVYELSKD